MWTGAGKGSLLLGGMSSSPALQGPSGLYQTHAARGAAEKSQYLGVDGPLQASGGNNVYGGLLELLPLERGPLENTVCAPGKEEFSASLGVDH